MADKPFLVTEDFFYDFKTFLESVQELVVVGKEIVARLGSREIITRLESIETSIDEIAEQIGALPDPEPKELIAAILSASNELSRAIENQRK